MKSTRRSTPVLSYQTPIARSWAERLSPLRAWFWVIAAAIMLGTLLVEAGSAWPMAVWQLLTSGLLLVAWIASAWGWGGMVCSLVAASRPCQGTQLRTGEAPVPQESSTLLRITTIATGLGTLSLLLLALGLLGWLSQAVAIGMLALGVIAFLWRLYRTQSRLTAKVDFVYWPTLLAMPLLGIMLFCTMLPAGILWGSGEPNGYDVVEYHLQVPREWFEAGKITPLTHNVFSFFPFNVEMHYLWAMHLMGGPWMAQFLAQMMHGGFIVLSVIAVYAAVERYGRGKAVWAALLMAATPWMPMLGSIAYDEGGFLLFGVLAIAWMMRGIESKDEGGRMKDEKGASKQVLFHPSSFILHPWIVAGAMAGFACGAKLTAVPLVLLLVPAAAWAVCVCRRTTWGERRKVTLAAVGSVVVGLAVFSPWMVRNIVWVKNPVFPELQSALGRGYFSIEQQQRFERAHTPRPDQQAMSARLAEFWRQVPADWRFGYAVLPIGWLAMILSLRRAESRFLLVMVVGITVFWVAETHLQGRFYLLAVPVVASAVGLAAMNNIRWMISAGCVIAVLVLCNSVYVGGKEFSMSDSFYLRSNLSLNRLVGFTELDQATELKKEIDGSTVPVVLLGDAEAFLFHVPMSQLHYRTVFDVDMSNGRTASEAWSADLPNGTTADFWINEEELQRFQKTYQLPRRPDFWTDLPNLPGFGPFMMQWTVDHSPRKPGRQ